MSGRFPILYIAEADPETAVLSSGVLAHLVEEIPHASFIVVGSRASAPLFADLPRLDALIVLEREGRLEWVNLWKRVRSTKWGLVVDQRGTDFSARLKRQRRAVKPAAASKDDGRTLHAVEQAARALQLDTPPSPRLFFGHDAMAIADQALGGWQGPLLAVGPGADWVGKRWPAERFAKAAAPLLAEGGPLDGAKLLIVGGDEDRDAAHTIRLAAPRYRVIETQGRLTPLQACAALSRASLYLGNDSLWTQLAVAAGVPSVGVFGPSDERLRGPWRGRSVRGPRMMEDFRAIDPKLNQAIQHMMDLPVEPVLNAARSLYAQRAREAEAAHVPQPHSSDL
ncbi:glycosyltransferase family 9 protein [Brevundimonas sp.]|uniref:glycosyltransferase family 9 protein n=1 Tax=Brevundimonas sp. TaxID=1871086 RepID=UPI0035B2FD99